MSKNNNSSNNKNRREFLKTTALGGLAAITLPSLSFGKNSSLSKTPFKIDKTEFDEITVNELSDGIKSGKYTVRSIAEHYIKRIQETDKKGPAI